MKKNIIFLGPLGWKKNIWNKVVNKIDDSNFIYFEFPNDDYININEYIDFCINKLNSLDTGIIVASSYGVSICLSILDKLTINLKGIILIDGITEPPSISDINSIYTTRCFKYENLASYIDTELDEDEKKDKFIVDVMTSTYIDEKNEHFMSNDSLKKHLLYLTSLNNIYDNLNKDFKFWIFNNEHIDLFDRDNIVFENITSNEHLLMLTSPDKINNSIKYFDV